MAIQKDVESYGTVGKQGDCNEILSRKPFEKEHIEHIVTEYITNLETCNIECESIDCVREEFEIFLKSQYNDFGTYFILSDFENEAEKIFSKELKETIRKEML